jgi:hypothetical protein
MWRGDAGTGKAPEEVTVTELLAVSTVEETTVTTCVTVVVE